MGSKELTFNARMETNKVIDYLESIIASLRHHSICIQKGDEYTMLAPGDLLDMSVEAANKKDNEQLSIKLSWDKASLFKNKQNLKISTGQPTIVPFSAQQSA
ncbi:MAG: amphi-Trp domain-containing protein [Candidatus Auribacterota bacterium]